MPWRRKRQPRPVFLPEKSHGERSLASYSPWGCKESDMTEWLNNNQDIIMFGPWTRRPVVDECSPKTETEQWSRTTRTSLESRRSSYPIIVGIMKWIMGGYWPKASSGRNEATFREPMTSREGEIDKKSFFFLHASDVRLGTLWAELQYKPAFQGTWEIKQ